MKRDDFLHLLLDALEDKYVKKAIRQIVSKEESITVASTEDSDKFQQQIKQLKAELTQTTKQLVEKEQQLKEVITELDQVKQQMRNKKQHLEEVAQQLYDTQQINTQLQNNVVMKNRQIEQLQDDATTRAKENNRLITENKRMEERLAEIERQQAEGAMTIRQLQSRFQGIEEAYAQFTQLSFGTRNTLQGIFKGTTIDEFLYCGIQHDNIETLWEFIKREMIEGRLNETEQLTTIFQFFFDAHNKIYDTPLYEMLYARIGQTFDEDAHIRGNGSKVSGQITNVLFNGYRNTKTNKIIKKSIVQV